jgi:hypothetical protein
MNNPNALVLTHTYHVADNWYGKNYRMVLSTDAQNGFANITEAKKYRGAFVKYFNTNVASKSKGIDKIKVADIVIGTLDSFVTYRYCGAGPSYSVSNFYRTLDNLK